MGVPPAVRGRVRSLTVPEIDETPRRELLNTSRERTNCRTTGRYCTQRGSENIKSSSSRSALTENARPIAARTGPLAGFGETHGLEFALH